MTIVPWFCYGNVGGTADLTGAVVVSGAMNFGANVGAISLVPATVLDATGVADPVWSIGSLT